MKLAGIDVGSNAIRLVIAQVDRAGRLTILKKQRESLRLGHDAFSKGRFSKKTIEKAVACFKKFRGLLKLYGVPDGRIRAVGTSALREATNQQELINNVFESSGIFLEAISGHVEGQIIFDAVASKLDLTGKRVLLIDIGGGSLELSVVQNKRLIEVQSFPLGTVRLLESLKKRHLQEKHIDKYIRTQLGPLNSFLRRNMKPSNGKFDFAIGTGGNFEALGRLRIALMSKTIIYSMNLNDLKSIESHLNKMTIQQRVKFLNMKPDRADVIVPASILTRIILETAKINYLSIPFVGLKDGLLKLAPTTVDKSRT